MFVGAIESEFRRWFILNKEAFRGRTLFVGCSGNFTIEQLLGEIAGDVHSNDVSIYTHFVGHRLAGQQFVRAIKDPEWAWLQPFLDQDEAATMVLLFEVLKWDPTKNAHNKRLYSEYMGAWDGYFNLTSDRIKKAAEACHITTFRSSDIWNFVDEAREIDPDGIFTAFLPFYKGGYERLYKKLDQIFSWEPPAYEIIDPERKAQLIQKIKAFDHVFIDDVSYPEEPAVMLKRKTATKQMWLYSNLDLKHVLVNSHTRSQPTNYVMFGAQDVPNVTPASTVVIKRIRSAEMNYFRNRYLAKGIEFVDGMWNFLFFIDGKLLGFAILTRQKFGEDGLYLLSDFAVPADKDCRLAKLVLLLLQSRHFQEVCEELVLDRVPKLTTTAFTDKPVSQKYRSAGFELVKRGEHPGGKKFLNYKTDTGLHSDREAIEKWLRGRKRAKGATS